MNMSGKILIQRDLYDTILGSIKDYVKENEHKFKGKEAYKDCIVSYINENYPLLLTNDIVILDKKTKGKGFCCIDYTETPTNIVTLLTAEF